MKPLWFMQGKHVDFNELLMMTQLNCAIHIITAALSIITGG